MRSDWSPMLYQSTKHRKSVFYWFSLHYLYTIKQMKKPKPELEPCITLWYKCRKHSPAAHVFYISSNIHRVLSQYNTRLRPLYLLNKVDSLFQKHFSNTHPILLSFKQKGGYWKSFSEERSNDLTLLSNYNIGHWTKVEETRRYCWYTGVARLEYPFQRLTFPISLQYHPECIWGNFGLFCSLRTKLPRIYA